MRYKYIRHYKSIYIFPEYINHWEFAEKNHLTKEEIQSAGFVSISDGCAIRFYGRSISLNIDSHPEEDKEIFENSIYN